MVKVQKPTPKTFSPTGGNKDKAIKKKKDKTEKLKSIKDVGAAAKVEPAAAKKEKSKLIAKAVKEAKVVAPVEKEKVSVKADKMKPNKKEKQPAAPPATENGKKEKKQKQEQPSKRPLVLAPPESPKPTVAAPKSEKVKNKKEKKTAEVPAAAPTPSSPKKKNKSKKTTPLTTTAKPKKGARAPKPPKTPQPPLTKAQKKKQTKRAFKKQQVKNKNTGKDKKEKAPRPQVFEPVPFDEEKFAAIVNVANVKKIATALKQLVEKEVTEKKTSIFSDYSYCLNVCSFKIPSCPKRMVKLNLKHSLVDKDDDVVVVVADVQRGSKVDFEPTIQHYDDLFREAGIEGLKVMPFNQLRNECNTFESVRKLRNTYDYFLCDGRLVGQVAGFCGKVFQKPRSVFHSVRFGETKNLKVEIEKALCRTAYKQLSKGDLTSIPVGNHKYTMQQLAENVDHVVEQLKTLYPGGLGNIRGLYLKIDIVGTSSLPIYVSMGQVPAETPYVVGPRERRMLKLKKDANEVLSKFSMTKDADIVKLSKAGVERKRKLKEARKVLSTAENEENENADDAAEEEPVAAEEEPVPAKKARKEKSKVENVEPKPKKDGKKKKSVKRAKSAEDGDVEENDDAFTIYN